MTTSLKNILKKVHKEEILYSILYLTDFKDSSSVKELLELSGILYCPLFCGIKPSQYTRQKSTLPPNHVE